MIPPCAEVAAGVAGAALRDFARRHRLDRRAGPPLAVACSGGADSTALLLAAVQRFGPRRVRALHVHHGLQPAADDFAAHVRALCAAWDVPCVELAVRVDIAPGDSVEERARQARHTALDAAARQAGCDWLLLAHQADDQAESLLLALLRGAGPRGLAAMPEVARRDGLHVGRPLLGVAGDALRADLAAAGVPFAIDPMNTDPTWRRVRIRRELLPVIAALEPGWRQTLGRSARLCAQAAEAVAERAAADLATCRAAAAEGEGAEREGAEGATGAVAAGDTARDAAAAPGAGAAPLDAPLWLPALRRLSGPRLAEALRAWLDAAGVRSSSGQIDNLCRQVASSARGDAAVDAAVGGARVARRGRFIVLQRSATGCAERGVS